jgi:hypothetical protein
MIARVPVREFRDYFSEALSQRCRCFDFDYREGGSSGVR